jgi:large subunit ribosomal protein L23
MTHFSTILICPILSEKSAMLGEKHNKYAFKVAAGANKLEIKKAVEDRFNVKVVKVATLNMKGKLKNTTIRSNGRVIRTSGFRSSWKKAIVTLEKDHSIDFVGGEF